MVNTAEGAEGSPRGGGSLGPITHQGRPASLLPPISWSPPESASLENPD